MRTINKLTAQGVRAMDKRGRYGDGGGLWLQVSAYGTKAWLFRYMINGRARQMGLGSVETFSLKEARERARLARQMVADGIDPITEKENTRLSRAASAAKILTFDEAAKGYIKAHRTGWRNPKHATQWQNTIKTYVSPTLGRMSVADIETSHVISILEPIWDTKTETASRVRGRIESILDWASARNYRSGDNPARWRGHLDKLLAARGKVSKVRHHPAMPYDRAGTFIAQLVKLENVSSRALEFTILTAARTSETTGARWDEINLQEKIWLVPGGRMKSGRDHRVPLSNRVIEILNALPRLGEYVFPGAKDGCPLSNMAMLQQLQGMSGCQGLTVHGFRSTFRDWVAEQTDFPRDLAEAALAHVVADKTEAAYRRGDALEKRRLMMEAWAQFCSRVGQGCDAFTS